jgi:glycosyltransferase involved in cell wall biosynthesis
MTKTSPRPGQQLRIALFSGNYNYSIDGPVRALNRLVAYLERKGHKVLVIAPTKKQAAFKHEGTLVSVPSFPFPGRGEYRVGMSIPCAVRQQLEDFQPNLFHLACPDLLGYKALSLAQKWHIPAVASFHTRFDTYPRYYGMAFLEKYLTRYMRFFYHQCEQVYVPSESMKDILREQDMAEDMRIWTRGVDSTLFNPAKRDPEWRRSLGISDSEIVICFVGRLVLEKGIDFMAGVLDQLTANGVSHRALIIGDGPERSRLAKRLPTAHLLGYLGGEDLARAYASSDIFLNPSDTETFGNVTLEAMACGLPSVCADATGSRSLVQHGVSGFLAPPRDLTAYVEKLTLLAGDANLRKKMSKAALKLQHAYDWDVIMQGLLANYREVVEKYQGAAGRDMAA